jgi:stage III sporulation protein AB
LTIKIIGALLILISGSSIGWIISIRYLYRVEELGELQLAINIFDTEINYGQTVLSDALSFTAATLNGRLSHLFSETAELLSHHDGRTFNEVWRANLDENLYNNYLLKQDLQILEEWGQQIGSLSLSDQSKINQLTIKRLEYAEKKAREMAEKRVKLIRYSGVLISLMIIILFY